MFQSDSPPRLRGTERHVKTNEEINVQIAACNVTRYSAIDIHNMGGVSNAMIKKIKHKGLKRLYTHGETQGVQQDHVIDLREILSALDDAVKPKDMDLPGLDFHPLKGKRKDFFSVHVNGNWVVIFTFEGDQATLVDYLDYH
ncbi:type II toxin-antitoxin system RelE/ParE family toxin [Vreelandella sp. EE7]